MYLLRIDPAKRYSDYDRAAELLPPQRRAELEKRSSDMSAQSSLFAELLVRRHVIRELGTDNGSIELIRSAHGKPRLKGSDDIHFSVSHKDGIVCVEFSSCPIGIDIEAVSEPRYRIAEKTFTESERQALLRTENKAELFSTVWTRKEAYSKMLGTGYSCGFSKTETLSGEFDAICESRLFEGYVISSVGDGKPPLEITEISIDELLTELIGG